MGHIDSNQIKLLNNANLTSVSSNASGTSELIK